MCFVNQSICSGCDTITETPTPKKPYALTPDVLQYGCSGTKVVVEIEHTGPEFCSHCYNERYVKIQKKWERKEEFCMNKARKEGYTPPQVECLRGRVKQELAKEVMSLDQEWEKMWSS